MSAVIKTDAEHGLVQPDIPLEAPAAGDDPLIQLRLAYLRAVARSWRDAEFRQQLTTAADVQTLLQQHCGLCVDWPNLAIRVRDSNPPLRWNPLQVGGWMGPDDEFEIALPGAPQNEAERTEALTAYYQRFPTLMGVAVSVTPHAKFLAASAGSGGADVPTSAVLLPFGAVILRAIALSWANPSFRDELLAASDARTVLSQYFGYNSPFNFRVRFHACEAPSCRNGAWEFAWLQNRIVLNYPQVPPLQDKALWPVALTAYNDTGPAYPFTC
jgi:ribosomally synthesized peptide (two-chain TOMM family)